MSYADFFYNGECDRYGPILGNGSLKELVDLYAEEMACPEEPVIDKDELSEVIARIMNERADRLSADTPIEIRISHSDGSETYVDYNPDFGAPWYHAKGIMEELFPAEAEAGEIFSDGDRWYTNDGAEAVWYEKDDEIY